MYHHSCHKVLVHTCFSPNKPIETCQKMAHDGHDSGMFDEIDGNVTRMRVAGEQSVCTLEGSCPRTGANTAILGASQVLFSQAYFFVPQILPDATALGGKRERVK